LAADIKRNGELQDANGDVKIEMTDVAATTTPPHSENNSNQHQQQEQQIQQYYNDQPHPETQARGNSNDPFWSSEDEKQHQTQPLVDQ
jgi:uncharacterized membrane protein